MSASLRTLIADRIRRSGPMTVAEYMDLALYHPEYGYYATAARRSGREGDFYTSVDIGPLFGAMIAVQLEEIWRLLHGRGAQRMDLVEAGAGDGRLTRDILDAAARHQSDLYQHLHVTLVERSAAARERHGEMLSSHPSQYAGSSDRLPANITGVIVANELLDALPVHVIVGSEDGSREIYIGERDGTLVQIEGPLSESAVADYVHREEIVLTPGARAEVGLRAAEWIGQAAGALDSGFLLLFDYGLTAAELYSHAHAGGTLTTYCRHTAGSESWLANPGAADITAHVNLTAITRAAEAESLTPLGITDQTYFLLSLGITDRLQDGRDPAAISTRLSAKTLLLPGGLGSTMKVLAFAKAVGKPELRGFSSARLT